MNDNIILWYAVQSMWARLGPSLIRLSVDFSSNVAHMQFVVSSSMTELEEEDYQDASTEFLSYFANDSDIELAIVPVSSQNEAESIPPLKIKVMSRNVGTMVTAY